MGKPIKVDSSGIAKFFRVKKPPTMVIGAFKDREIQIQNRDRLQVENSMLNRLNRGLNRENYSLNRENDSLKLANDSLIMEIMKLKLQLKKK